MPRGGKRVGAGRKPGGRYSLLQRMKIGAHAERLWRQAVKVREEEALSAATRKVQQQWAKARTVPIDQDYLDDVRGAMQEDQGIDLVDDDREPDRVVTIAATRPKGIRDKIKRKVAAAHRVTTRTVESCWQEFRRFERETADDV